MEKKLDKYDPPMIATIKDNSSKTYSRLVMFRKSEEEKVKQKYGPKLDIWLAQ